VFIEHPPENSMASFNFTSAVPDEGTTFTLSSWVHRQLANPKKLEASAPTSSHDIDNLADDLGGIKLFDLI
jgi:hypothetical protein